jgi:aspartyl protease family protein
LALLLLATRQDGGTTAGMTNDGLAPAAVQAALVILVGWAAMTFLRNRLSEVLNGAVFWLVIAVLFGVGYTYRSELHHTGDRVLAGLVPAHAAARGRAVEIERGRAGEFQVATQINGARVPMVLDTGASAVVLTHEAARAAGLPLEVLNYTVSVETANGSTRAASVTLDRVAVGAIVERSVPALIAQPGRLKTNLLGMSFLNRLESWEVRSEKLLMRSYP